MRILRSMFFGCVAVLAAAFFTSISALAIEYSSPDNMLEVVSFEFVVTDAVKADAFDMTMLSHHERSFISHDVMYIIQNQPHSAFRQSVGNYSNIDPHIGLYT